MRDFTSLPSTPCFSQIPKSQERLQIDIKVTLTKGPCLPGKDGVGDYTTRLAEALRQTGTRVDVIDSGDWSLARLPSLVQLARQNGPDILHLQYPTTGYGYKLGPQGLAMAVPGVVTIHEVTRAHVLRKLSLYPFAVRPKHIIFTSQEERAFGLRWAPWIAQSSSVIPIGSNIETMPREARREVWEIVYFGLVMPRKGVEDVLKLAALMKREGHGLRIRVVGDCRVKDAVYAAEFRRKSEGLPLSWEQGLSDSEVGRRLAGSWIAYLPYPDGATERRGSLKAALANGMAVVTTRGADTPPDLEPVVKFCSSPSHALAVIRDLIASPEQVEVLEKRARMYAARYSWELIARKHLAIYGRLVHQSPARPEQEVGEQTVA